MAAAVEANPTHQDVHGGLARARVLVEGAESSFDSKDPEITSQELKPGESARVNLPLKPESLSSGTKGYLYIRVAIPIEVDTGNK